MAKSVSFSGYMAVGKDEANRILQEYLSEDGKFLVRPSDSGNALFTVSVVRKQRILKYPVNQNPADQHYQVSNYPDKFQHLEQLVQHYRQHSISSKETVLLREPVNGWPKTKGEYGVFVRPNSGSSTANRKPSMSVRNGPLPPIPALGDPVPNSGHKQADRQLPSNSSAAKRIGSASRAEQTASMSAPQSPSPGRRRAGSQRDSRPESRQEPPRDCRSDSWQDARQESHQSSRQGSRQNHWQNSQPDPRQESPQDHRHSIQSTSSSSSGVGCYIHTNLPHEDVQKVFAPYLARDGSYLIRPSATAGKMTLCVTHNGSIVNFRISRNEKTRLYQITSKKSFESIEELIEAYHSHPIKSKEKKVEIYLVEGIPSVEGSGTSDASLPSPTSPGDQNLPAPWVKYFSEENHKYYYHNGATGVTQWEPPLPRSKATRPLPSLPGEPEKQTSMRPRMMSLPSSERPTSTMKNRPLPSIPDTIKDSSPPPIPHRGPHPSATQTRQDRAPQHNGMPTVNHAGRPLPAKEEKAEPVRKGAPPALPPKVPASEENTAPPPLPAAHHSKHKRAPPPLPDKDPPVHSIPTVNGGLPPRPDKTREDPYDRSSRRVPQVPVGGPPSVPVGEPPSVQVSGPPSVPVGGPPSVPVGGPPSVPVGIPHSVPAGAPPSVPVGGPPSVPAGGGPPPPPPPPPPPIAPPSHNTLSLPNSDQLSRTLPSSPSTFEVGRRNTVTPAELVKGMTTLRRTERQEPAQKKHLDGMGGILSRKLDEMRSFVQQDSDSEIDEVESDEEDWS